MFFYQASLGLSVGAEWNFVGSTSLVAEMSYYYGLTPLFLDRKEENKTLYHNVNGEITPFLKAYFIYKFCNIRNGDFFR